VRSSVNLIAATTTKTGLRVQSQIDTGKYPKGIKAGKPEFAAVQLRPDTKPGIAGTEQVWL
jgi:Rhodopirellula transposase DDE domain